MEPDTRTATTGALIAGSAYAAGWLWRYATVDLEHYSPAEFGVWWPLMDAELLRKLDTFRRLWGGPVVINHANTGGLGRVGAKHADSMHYVGPTRKSARFQVRAADITPLVPVEGGKPRAIENGDELRRAYQAAIDAGFRGVGAYPGKAARWSKPGLHVDVRGKRKEGDPAKWARINRAAARRAIGLPKIQEPGEAYVGVSAAFDRRVWEA